MGNSEPRKRRQPRDKYDHDNHVYGTGSAHYTRAYVETKRTKNRFSLSSLLSFAPPFSISLSFHLSYSPISISMHATILSRSHPVFYSLSHSHFSTFSPFVSVRASSLPPLSILRPRLYRSLHALRPLSSLLLPLALLPSSQREPRSLSLAPTLFLCSISFTGKSEATGSYVACGFTRAHLLNRFLSLVLLARHGSIGHVARFGRGFHFQKNPDRTIPLGSRVRHRTRRFFRS